AESVAQILLLQEPRALVELRRQLPPGTDLPAVLESGLPGWLGLLEKQIYAQLEDADASEEEDDEEEEGATDEEAAPPPPPAAPAPPPGFGAPPAAPAPDPAALAAQADEGLRRLALLASVLEAVLAGEDPMSRVPELAAFGAQPGLDARGYLVTAAG